MEDAFRETGFIWYGQKSAVKRVEDFWQVIAIEERGTRDGEESRRRLGLSLSLSLSTSSSEAFVGSNKSEIV